MFFQRKIRRGKEDEKVGGRSQDGRKMRGRSGAGRKMRSWEDYQVRGK